MALSRQSLSPTASLLRSSRLFSLPQPLPRPQVGETYGAGTTKASDSATLPYPTHQAIATTKTSLARGDWGLKRPLPSRSQLLQVSDPVLRINQLDTIEHITDYDSAADHVRTRQKWEEMGVPVLKGMAQMREYDLSGTPAKSAFELRDDTTSYDADMGLDEAGLYLKALCESLDAKQQKNGLPFTPFAKPPVDPAVHNAKRWHNDGPWIPGMSADDFAAYLTKAISKERVRFNRYLVHYVKNDIYKTRRQQAARSPTGMPMDVDEAEAWRAQQEKEWANISDHDIAAGIRALRRETANNPLTSKLVTELIMPFLKLPAIRFKHTAYAKHATSRDVDTFDFDQETSPLSTHPSAGLGYLRTKAYLTNHPLLGPQSLPAPIPARVVQPRSTTTSTEAYARLGVAGFVANDQFRSTDTTSVTKAHIGNARDVHTIDLDTEGGKKVMVHPLFGSVSNDGRVWIKLNRAVGSEVLVGQGALDDRPPVRERTESGAELLSGLASMGKSEGTGMDERSESAKRLTELLNSVASREKTVEGGA